MITDTACLALQTSAEERPSVPPWFAEVVLIAQSLTQHGVLSALTHQVRLVRERFGEYEVIDFLVLLFGYAISGERTLQDFFTRLTAFAMPFMALFGRVLPPSSIQLESLSRRRRSSLSGGVANAIRKDGSRQEWSKDDIGGVWDRQGQRHVVFDVDATRQAARQRALPAGEDLPEARRR